VAHRASLEVLKVAPQAVDLLKALIQSTVSDVESEDLWLTYWNADGVRGRKLELEQFFSVHCGDVCILKRCTFSRVGH
jgi:hypothetical protein